MDKKYIIVCGTLTQGGAERVISILSKEMVQKGFPVEILLYYDRPLFYEIDPRVRIVTVEKETGQKNLLRNLRWMRKYFKTNAKEIISFLAPFNMVSIAASFGTGIPIIVADRNDPRKVPGNPVSRKVRDFLYRFADGVALQTEYNRAYFSTAVQRKSNVIYNPVSLGPKAGLALRTEKQKKIVSVGRLMPQKNQQMLISAFADVHKNHPDYKLTIYGDGPLKEQLQEQIERLGLKEYVHLPGSVQNVFECIAGSELFVLSSDYEGMPNALIEAMCLGLPVISTRVSGATDLIQHGENGLLVDVEDKDSLVLAMEELLNAADLQKQLAENAMQINEQLEISKITSQWIEFITAMEKKRQAF